MSVTTVTLVHGGDACAREAAIRSVIRPQLPTAVILEGLHDGKHSWSAFVRNSCFHLARIAPGCLCCTGGLTMRVTLNRILRQKPLYLFVALSHTEHLVELRSFLSQATYKNLLIIGPDLLISSGPDLA